jgi:hypothetical protein
MMIQMNKVIYFEKWSLIVINWFYAQQVPSHYIIILIYTRKFVWSHYIIILVYTKNPVWIHITLECDN